MAWLLRGGEVLASLEVARDRRSRMRGLLGRESMEGALWMEPARAVHTVGMRFAIDVAYLDGEGTVLDIHTMARYRVGWPRWHARAVLEANAGAFERWRLRPGDVVEIKE
jgi:uncharacterized protein